MSDQQEQMRPEPEGWDGNTLVTGAFSDVPPCPDPLDDHLLSLMEWERG